MAFGLSPLVEFLRMDEAAAAAADDGGVVILGVEFVATPAADMKLRQMMYLSSESRKVGIRPMEEYAALGDPTKFGVALMADAFDSGHAFTFLAALLVRKGERWNPEKVAENAALFEQADMDASPRLMALLGQAASGFFGSGTSSSPTSPISSSAARTGTPGPSDSPAPLAATTAPSTAPSGISLVETAAGTRRSSAGKPVKSSSRGARSHGSAPSTSGASSTSSG